MALRKCDPLLIVCIWMSKAVIYAVTTRLFLEWAGGNGGENLILISVARTESRYLSKIIRETP